MGMPGRILVAAVLALLPGTAFADTLFRNVRVYDGKAGSLSAPTSVLVQGNRIAAIGPGASAAPGATVVEGEGRTLMPGLIDAHWHAMFVRPTPEQMMLGDYGFNVLQAGAEATATLMRGFTTVRDVGGPVFGLKQAIDLGVVEGPRIWSASEL